MYPGAFHYQRAGSFKEAASMLSELGEGAKVLAGGQSLIPLMKLRFANPSHLIDINFISDASYIKKDKDLLCFGALTRHAEIATAPVARKVPILHDCAAGIADVQVRNRGTIGGSLAEADPSGDWAPVLLTLATEVRCVGPQGERTLALADFIKDAYTTALARDELVSEVAVRLPQTGSGGAYLGVKRAAPVYPTASVAVQLSLQEDICKQAAIVLGCVGLTPIRAKNAEAALCGRPINDKVLSDVNQAARAAVDPQSDMRGSAEYKRTLVGALVKRAVDIALRRARGETVEVSHIYA
jgi:carbon-monoxide dehydrogenase medium subunit